MAAGDIIRSVETVVEQQLGKTTTAITKGLVLVYDTDGLNTAGADAPGPHYMAYEDHAAPTAGQTEFSAVKRGWVVFAKAAGAAVTPNAYVKSDANGKIVDFIPGTDLAEEIVGYSDKDGAASAATEVKVFLGGR